MNKKNETKTVINTFDAYISPITTSKNEIISIKDNSEDLADMRMESVITYTMIDILQEELFSARRDIEKMRRADKRRKWRKA